VDLLFEQLLVKIFDWLANPMCHAYINMSPFSLN